MFKVFNRNIVLNNKGGNHKVTLVIGNDPISFYTCPEDWCICFKNSDTVLSLPVSKEPSLGERLYIICDLKNYVVFGGTRHADSAAEIAKGIQQQTRLVPIVISEVFGRRVSM